MSSVERLWSVKALNIALALLSLCESYMLLNSGPPCMLGADSCPTAACPSMMLAAAPSGRQLDWQGNSALFVAGSLVPG